MLQLPIATATGRDTDPAAHASANLSPHVRGLHSTTGLPAEIHEGQSVAPYHLALVKLPALGGWARVGVTVGSKWPLGRSESKVPQWRGPGVHASKGRPRRPRDGRCPPTGMHPELPAEPQVRVAAPAGVFRPGGLIECQCQWPGGPGGLGRWLLASYPPNDGASPHATRARAAKTKLAPMPL